MNCIQPASPQIGLILEQKNKRSERRNSKNKSRLTLEHNNVDCYYSPGNCAVYIRDLCKGYGGSGPPVVQNLSMNVRKGTIYSLLGASGCGKTTVLSCIVGLRKWDSGDVQVFGTRPGTKESGIPGKRLGYMPQDLALYNQLTIREITEFYGRIYNMSSSEMRERWIFLNKLLSLPTDFKLIGNLSGGQKRRASLALALIHCPDLLILDEPTVGLDPLLRRNIWNHLYKIVSTLGTTIIITTHYIEEARLSNTIGVMRKGRLLVEDSPVNLLTFYNSSLLEDVVLQLCRNDEKNLKVPSKHLNNKGNIVQFKSPWKPEALNSSLVVSREEHEFMDGIFRKAVGFDCEINQYLGKSENTAGGHGMRAGFYTKIKNNSLFQAIQRIHGFNMVILRTFIRYPLFIALILLLPTIQGYLTLATVGTKPSGMGIGIVNNELSNWTLECSTPKNLDESSCQLSELSCGFLRQLKDGGLVDLYPYPSEEAALNATHLGKVWGYLSLDTNFSQHSLDLAASGRFAENETLEGSRVRAYLDYSQYVATFFMVKDFFRAYGEYVTQLAEVCDIGGKQTEMPLEFRSPVYGHYEDNYTEFLMPGILLSSLLGIGTVLVAVIFITDRKQGTLSRACVAGLTSTDIIMGHMISQGIVTIAQIIIWNIILHFVFGLEIHGNILLYLVMCILVGLCGTAIGILLGIICRDEVEALIFGVFWSPILLLFGGVFWPVESMSHFWQNVGMVLPTTLPIKSLRSVLVRGVGLTHRLVWPGVLVLLGWIIVFSLLVGLTYKRFYK